MSDFEKLELESVDLVAERVATLKYLFPEVVADNAVDFDKLRLILGDEVDDGDERYAFTWPGKAASIRQSQMTTNATLRPCVNKSRGRDGVEGKFDSDNLYIEGDNLEVLKILRRSYGGEVDMIYIDPPYNTGSDFVYKDSFANSVANYKKQAQLVNQSNPNTSGRFHSDWCSMMYPRLRLAHDLLSNSGILFVSINEVEQANLEKILNEIFGEDNHIATLIWQNKKGGGNDSNYIAVEHEYVAVYARDKSLLKEFYEAYSDRYVTRYKEADDRGKYYWDTFRRKSGKQYYPITCPDGSVLEYDTEGNKISWLRSEERFKSDLENGEIRFIETKDGWSVQFKQRLPKGKKPRSIFTTETVVDSKGTTSDGSKDVYTLFQKDVFSNPKPVELLEWLIGFGASDGALVLDFFSGSGTLAEAVYRSNARGAKRKFILVQIPERIELLEKGQSAEVERLSRNVMSVLGEAEEGYFITDLAEERIRRSGDKLKSELGNDVASQDLGFRVFTLDESSVIVPKDGELFSQVVKPGRSELDIVFEMMLKWGLELTLPVDRVDAAGYGAWSVASSELVCCLAEGLTYDALEAVASMQPRRVLILDSVLTDSLKLNAIQIFKRASERTGRGIELRTI